ncbi:MAG TPA: DUF3617 domain-containing protein [Bryobacteraceae bacterium]|nr:DUF3617 domain-containing protein [Bryobacteraceae bacterium]
MTAKYVCGCVLLAVAAWAADAVTPLDIRPGSWEGTMTTQRSGSPPIPPELLSKMSPDQQAALEAQMKARGSQAPQTTVRKQCVRKEDLQKPISFGDDRGSCQRTIVSASSTKQEFRIECTNAGIKASGRVHIEAVDAEHIKFTSSIAAGDGAHSMKINTTGTGKWVGAECSSESKK